MEKERLTKELETEKIGKLLFRYALPSIISMTATSIYNVIDSIFVGHGVGPLALSGLAVTLPFMNIIIAFSTLIGVGTATLMSMRLGQKDYDTTKMILGNSTTLSILAGLLMILLGIFFLDPILTFFGASANTLPYAHDFMTVYLAGNIFAQLFFSLNALLRATGAPKMAMISIIGTVVINTALNPLFIFGLHMGIQGSALATVISQAVMLIWQIRFFSNKKNIVHFQKGTFGLRRVIVRDGLSFGISSFLMHIASCIVVIIINNGLSRYGGDMAVGAYGIVTRFSFIFGMLVIGLIQGMQPIAGYNYGAKLYPRVTQVLKVSILWATVAMCIGFFLGELCPRAVTIMFTNDEELIRQSVNGLRIVMVSAPIIGFQMITSSFFNCIGMAKKAIFLTLSRQLIFLIPMLLILPHFFGLNGIWISQPASDILATVITGILLWRQFSIFKHHPDRLPTA